MAVVVETWRYSARLGLYFQERAERTDYVAGHDDGPMVVIDFGPPMEDGEEEHGQAYQAE